MLGSHHMRGMDSHETSVRKRRNREHHNSRNGCLQCKARKVKVGVHQASKRAGCSPSGVAVRRRKTQVPKLHSESYALHVHQYHWVESARESCPGIFAIQQA